MISLKNSSYKQFADEYDSVRNKMADCQQKLKESKIGTPEHSSLAKRRRMINVLLDQSVDALKKWSERDNIQVDSASFSFDKPVSEYVSQRLNDMIPAIMDSKLDVIKAIPYICRTKSISVKLAAQYLECIAEETDSIETIASKVGCSADKATKDLKYIRDKIDEYVSDYENVRRYLNTSKSVIDMLRDKDVITILTDKQREIVIDTFMGVKVVDTVNRLNLNSASNLDNSRREAEKYLRALDIIPEDSSCSSIYLDTVAIISLNLMLNANTQSSVVASDTRLYNDDEEFVMNIRRFMRLVGVYDTSTDADNLIAIIDLVNNKSSMENIFVSYIAGEVGTTTRFAYKILGETIPKIAESIDI